MTMLILSSLDYSRTPIEGLTDIKFRKTNKINE